MTNVVSVGTQNQDPPRKRLQQLQAFCFSSFDLGARNRKDLARVTRKYHDEHQLNIPAELIGQTVLFVIAQGAT